MSETFTDIIAEISATRPRVPEIMDFSEERLKKVGIMVRPTLLNVLKFVRDNLDAIQDDVLETLVKSYDTIYTTNNAYDLQTKLQMHVEGKEVPADTVVNDVVDEVLAEEDEPTITPSMDGPIIETTAEVVEPTADDDAPESVVVEEPEPAPAAPPAAEPAKAPEPAPAAAAAPTPAPAAPAAPKADAGKPARKPKEKSRVEELVAELMAKYQELEKDHKRLTKENETLKAENTKLKEQNDNLQAEGSVSNSLIDRLEKMVKGAAA